MAATMRWQLPEDAVLELNYTGPATTASPAQAAAIFDYLDLWLGASSPLKEIVKMNANLASLVAAVNELKTDVEQSNAATAAAVEQLAALKGQITELTAQVAAATEVTNALPGITEQLQAIDAGLDAANAALTGATAPAPAPEDAPPALPAEG